MGEAENLDADAVKASIVAALEELDRLAQSPDAGVVLEVLDHSLRGEVGPDTYGEIVEGISVVLSDSAGTTLFWLTRGDLDERLRLADVSDSGRQFLRRVVAVYGSRLIRATEAADLDLPGSLDWRRYKGEVLRSVPEGTYRVITSIERRDGSNIQIVGDRQSAFRFATRALETVGLIEDLSGLSERDVGRFQAAMEIVGPKLESSDSAGASDA